MELLLIWSSLEHKLTQRKPIMRICNQDVPKFATFWLLANSRELVGYELAWSQRLTAQRRLNVFVTSNNQASFPSDGPRVSTSDWYGGPTATCDQSQRRLIGRHRLILARSNCRSKVFLGHRQLRFIKLQNFVRQIKV